MGIYINKSLQINPCSYGRLNIVANSVMEGGFIFTTYSYTDAGGKHQHNNFHIDTANQAIEIATALYLFTTNRKKPKEEKLLLMLKQKHESRGELFLSIRKDNQLMLSIGRYISSDGQLALTKKQAKKIAGYLFFWAGESFIGKRKIKAPAKTSYILDIDDE